MKPPIPYYGSKQTLGQSIAALLPEHDHYVEPYAGSLAVLLAKRPSRMETVNDLDSDLMVFWRVLRDDSLELERVCALTPHSRAEYEAAKDADLEALPDLERARLVWVRLTQGRAGTMRSTGWRHFQDPAGSSSGMPRYLAGYVSRLAPVADRLAGVSLECRPALEIIEAYGRHPGVLLYVDPPYLGSTRARNYRHEMTSEDDHRLVTEQRFTGPFVVLHNDLGITRSGHSVEWPGVEALAREHAERYGFRFEVRRRELGGLWDQLLNERRKWMSSAARWCTSDQKTSQGMKLVTELVNEFRAEAGITGRPVRVLYALGIRGEESDNRAKKPVLAVDEAHSSRNRTITRWHPIRDWTVGEVWAEIKAAGLRPHAAYSWGMSRLSCTLCVLASPEDLFLAAWLRPELASDYLWAEQELGHRFRLDLSMVEIVSGLHVAEMEAADNPTAEATLGALAGMIRAIVQEQHDAKNVERAAAGKPPFPAERVEHRTATQLDKVIRCARRALGLAPGRTSSDDAGALFAGCGREAS